jgi:hypothetical protein
MARTSNALDALRRKFVYPGEDHYRRETDDQENEYQGAGPFGHRQEGREDVGDLQQQPGGDHIQDRHLGHVAAFELGDERHMRSERLPSLARS